MDFKEYDEIETKHRKKSKTASTSKSNKKIDHKHDYEKIIEVQDFGVFWAEKCRICGKFSHPKGFYRDKTFVIPSNKDRAAIGIRDFYTVDELKKKFPGYRIFKSELQTNPLKIVYTEVK